jgi:hypothetical protein
VHATINSLDSQATFGYRVNSDANVSRPEQNTPIAECSLSTQHVRNNAPARQRGHSLRIYVHATINSLDSQAMFGYRETATPTYHDPSRTRRLRNAPFQHAVPYDIPLNLKIVPSIRSRFHCQPAQHGLVLLISQKTALFSPNPPKNGCVSLKNAFQGLPPSPDLDHVSVAKPSQRRLVLLISTKNCLV